MSDFTKRLRQIESENSECSILAGNCADAIEIEQKKVAIEIARLRAENVRLLVAFEQAANDMRPMLRSMISRGEAAEIVRRAAAAALKETDDV